ncbi:MAG: M67 family metallopeptidase [Dehalococcoidia bacterium]
MLQISRKYVAEMFAHAREENPNECCGIIAGQGGSAVKLFRTTNSEHSPYRYNVEPRELLQVHREIEANDWDLLGIYHSHTGSPARPSPTDVRLAANWPEALYLIVSLAEGPDPALRAFRIEGGEVLEEEIKVV